MHAWPAGLVALGWFLLYSAVATGVYAIALALRKPRGLQNDTVREWAGEVSHSVALDVGLAGLSVALLLLDLRSGALWWPWSGLLLPLAVWLVVRCLLYAAGAKRLESLQLVGDDLVHGAAWGTERAPLAAVLGAVTSGHLALFELDRPANRRPCPRLWRTRLPAPNRMIVDTSGFGIGADNLAAWVAERARVGPTPPKDAHGHR